MSKNVDAKKQVVDEIVAKINGAKSVVLINYMGLTVAEDTAFRNEFRKNSVEYKVLKNTLVKRAFDSLNIEGFDNDLNGPTAVAFGADETSAAKVAVDSVKKFNDKISVKSAYICGEYVNESGVKKYAAIPSKPELYSMLAGTLSGFTRSLAVALNRVAEQKA